MELQEKIDTLKTVSLMVDKRTKRAPKDTVVAKALGLFMFNEYQKLVKPLIKEGGSVQHTKAAINKYLKKINNTMKTFPSKIETRVNDDIDYIYRYSKASFAEKHKITKAKTKPPEIPVSLWHDRDEEAITALQRQTNDFAGSFYSNNVQAAVADSVSVNVFERGLTAKEAGEALQKDLMKAFRMDQGTLESKVVPPGFRGKADRYFVDLAEHQAQMARTSSLIYAMDDAGATKFTIHSVKTDRTCLGCLNMDGVEFSVPDGVKHVEKLLSANDVDELKAIQPSFHFKPDGENSPAKIAEAATHNGGNVEVPPFHPRCECYVSMS